MTHGTMRKNEQANDLMCHTANGDNIVRNIYVQCTKEEYFTIHSNQCDSCSKRDREKNAVENTQTQARAHTHTVTDAHLLAQHSPVARTMPRFFFHYKQRN